MSIHTFSSQGPSAQELSKLVFVALKDDTTRRIHYHSMHDVELYNFESLPEMKSISPETLQNKCIILLITIITGLIFMGWINKFC